MQESMTLSQFRAAHATGGFTDAQLVGVGGRFYVLANGRLGDSAILVRDADRAVRFFSRSETALKLLQDVGFATITVELKHWAPQQGALKIIHNSAARARAKESIPKP